VKKSFRKDFRIIFLRETFEFKKNYLKRHVARGEHERVTGLSRLASGRVQQEQGSSVAGWRNEKWVTTLGQCGKRR
jgi:hypothetical protein